MASVRLHAMKGGRRARKGRRGRLDAREAVVASGLLDVYRSLDVETTANKMKQKVEEVEEEDDVCPVECVEELSTIKDFRERVLLAEPTTLIVLDLYKPSCGACKYIANGFAKLCKREGESEFKNRKDEEFVRKNVMFYKHNVVEDYDEEKTDLCRFLKVRNVPLFQFYKNGVMVEQFSTRDKERIASAILKYRRRVR